MKTWELINVEPVDCTLDDSGIYTMIHRKQSDQVHKGYPDSRVFVRCDIVLSAIQPGNSRTPQTDIPLISFQGLEDDVRKYVIEWIRLNGYRISTEHASHIGRELFRAVHDFNYVQD